MIQSSGRNSPSKLFLKFLRLLLHLYRLKRRLEPLAMASNITQSTHCRLDEVLLTFGTIYKDVLDWDKVTENDIAVYLAVLASLEKRWKKSDQDIFIAAVILNPFIRKEAFAKRFINNAGVYALLSRLWTRFYRQAPPEELYKDVEDYLNFKGEYQNLQHTRKADEITAHRQVVFFYYIFELNN